MSATQSVEPRRTSPPTAGTNRELPVLFHLMDVSRLKSPATAAVLRVPAEPPSEAEIEEAPREFKLAAPEPPPEVETTRNSTCVETPELEAPLASVPMADLVDTPAATITLSPPAADQDIAAQPPDGETAEKAPPAAAPAAIPRKEAERRPAKARSQRGNEWFANQGKFIAIGFVLALIGTIFMARSNRGTSPTAAVQPHADPGEAGQQIAASETRPATVVGKLQEKQAKEANSGTSAATSPAKLADAAAGENAPQADLHPPTIPQVVREPHPSNQPDNNALFPWTEQQADRLAARPDAPSASPAAAPPAQYPVTGASGPPSPTYPTTATPNSSFAAPSQQQPIAPPDYRSPYMPAAPANSPQDLGQSFVPPSGGPGPNYVPSDNTARGYRYERTGSGPY